MKKRSITQKPRRVLRFPLGSRHLSAGVVARALSDGPRSVRSNDELEGAGRCEGSICACACRNFFSSCGEEASNCGNRTSDDRGMKKRSITQEAVVGAVVVPGALAAEWDREKDDVSTRNRSQTNRGRMADKESRMAAQCME